jgi:hypothetical protein
VYFLPNAEVVIDDRIATSDLAKLPLEIRTRPRRPWPRRRRRGQTLGQRCGDADAHHVDDAWIHQAASLLRCRRGRLGRSNQQLTGAVPRKDRLSTFGPTDDRSAYGRRRLFGPVPL